MKEGDKNEFIANLKNSLDNIMFYEAYFNSNYKGFIEFKKLTL